MRDTEHCTHPSPEQLVDKRVFVGVANPNQGLRLSYAQLFEKKEIHSKNSTSGSFFYLPLAHISFRLLLTLHCLFFPSFRCCRVEYSTVKHPRHIIFRLTKEHNDQCSATILNALTHIRTHTQTHTYSK